ncbi:MAG: RHS repeat domain-containing protein [Caldilineaceae bacterium]
MANAFDQFHCVIQQTDALSHTITLNYSTPAAGVTAVTDPEGNTATYYFDRFHRTTDRVDAAGNMISYIYDGVGNLTKVIDAAFGQWDLPTTPMATCCPARIRWATQRRSPITPNICPQRLRTPTATSPT